MSNRPVKQRTGNFYYINSNFYSHPLSKQWSTAGYSKHRKIWIWISWYVTTYKWTVKKNVAEIMIEVVNKW